MLHWSGSRIKTDKKVQNLHIKSWIGIREDNLLNTSTKSLNLKSKIEDTEMNLTLNNKVHVNHFQKI